MRRLLLISLLGPWFMVSSILSAQEPFWTAYNDCVRDPGDQTADRVTRWTIYGGGTDQTEGSLQVYAGQTVGPMPTVRFTTNPTAPVSRRADYGDNLAPGTDAYTVFHDIVDFSGSILQHHSSNSAWWVDITFSGLDPDMEYSFVGTAIRVSPSDTDRISRCSIRDIESAVNNSGYPNGHSDWVEADSTKFLAVNNAALGLVVRWDQIRPGADGRFTIRTEADKTPGSQGRRAYPLHGFMLQAFRTSGNYPPRVDAGEYDPPLWPQQRVSLQPTIQDDDPCNLGQMDIFWSQLSGPQGVVFEPDAMVPNPVAVFPAPGTYELLLQVWDEVPQEANDVTTITVTEPGSLRVTLLPTELHDLGIRWRVDEGEWQTSGSLVANLAPGTHHVDYLAIPKWDAPFRESVQIVGGQTTEHTARYWPSQADRVVINEFMAVNSYVPATHPLNISTQVYGQETHPDWIELHNLSTSRPVNLSGWYLTDDPKNLTKWRFPEGIVIPPHGFYIVFASEKRAEDHPNNTPFMDEDGALHTNFQLRSRGEYLALVESDGLTIAHDYSPGYPQQQGLVSYGIGADGIMGYLTNPTPGSRSGGLWQGAANSERYLGKVGDTTFSHDRGFYDSPFAVTITCVTPDATILYSTDGSEPTQVFTEPIPITTTTCLRSKAIKEGWLSSNIDTQTYLFTADVLSQSQDFALQQGYPSAWDSQGPADYAMDPEIVDLPETITQIHEGLQSIPSLSIVTSKDNLFGAAQGIYTHTQNSGLAWERSASAEYIDPCNHLEFQLNCGLRVQGGASRQPRNCPKHSLSLRFRGGYGPGKLKAELFPQSPVQEFDSLQLRAMYNNSWIHWDSGQRSRGSLIRDQWARDALIQMGHLDAGHGHYVHVYLNGLYWGVYNIHERQEASHYEAYYGGDSDSIDAISSRSATDGTTTSWKALLQFVASTTSNGINSEEYQQIQAKLDINNLMDYMIINHFGANSDWGHHNWRSAGGGSFNRIWRMYSWDAERILEGVTANVTGTNHNDSPCALFHNLRQSPEFRMAFADRLHKHCFNQGTLTPENAAVLWMNRAHEIDLAILCESARWGDYRRDVHSRSNGPYLLYTKSTHWLPEQIRLVTTYFPRRTQVLLNQYRAMDLYPDIAAPVFARQDSAMPQTLKLQMSNEGPGEIYYTLDGSDPRMAGGAVNPTAEVYRTTLTLSQTVSVKARVLNNRIWSALNEDMVTVGTLADTLRITEIMYHPQDPNAEYLELMNIGDHPLNLNHLAFTAGINVEFDAYEIAPGDYALVVQDPTTMTLRYGNDLPIAGQYTGKLSNSSETITCTDADNNIILQVTYKDWYDTTDGKGHSLTAVDPHLKDHDQWNQKESWRPSTQPGGSPGYGE